MLTASTNTLLSLQVNVHMAVLNVCVVVSIAGVNACLSLSVIPLNTHQPVRVVAYSSWDNPSPCDSELERWKKTDRWQNNSQLLWNNQCISVQNKHPGPDFKVKCLKLGLVIVNSYKFKKPAQLHVAFHFINNAFDLLQPLICVQSQHTRHLSIFNKVANKRLQVFLCCSDPFN